MGDIVVCRARRTGCVRVTTTVMGSGSGGWDYPGDGRPLAAVLVAAGVAAPARV